MPAMRSYRPADNRTGETTRAANGMLMPVAVSAIGHLFLLGLLIGTPNFFQKQDLPAGAISVNLVAVPSFTSAAPPGKKTQAPPTREMSPPKPKAEPPPKKKTETKETVVVPEPPVKEPVVVPEPPSKVPAKDAISLAPKSVAPKVSLKKKTYQAEKVVESAIKRIEKKTAATGQETREETGPSPIKDAIERMRAAVEEKEGGGGGGTTEGAIGQDATGVGGGLGGTGKPRPLELMDIYRVEIAHHIQKNWAYSEQMSGGVSNLTAWVMVEITREGEIRDFWFEKRSGSSYLDDSAAKAIQKSNPLPPFPPGVTQSKIHQGFRFTPAGIQ